MTAPAARPLRVVHYRPLRVVHYLPAIRLADGGVVRAVLDWCGVFAEQGHAVSLVTCDATDVPPAWFTGDAGRPTAILVPPPRPPLNQLGHTALQAIDAALSGADVVHLHSPWYAGNRQVAGLARRRGVPYVVSLHGMLSDWSMSQKAAKKRAYLALLGRHWLERAAVAHCTADDELTEARHWFRPGRTAVLPCLVDLGPFRTLPGPDLGTALLPPALRDVPRLLFVSRLHAKKGVDVLIRAAGLLRDAGRPFAVAIAGAGDPAYERELRGLVAGLNLGDRVAFLGLVTGPAKLSLYQSADVFVLPTRDENFGLVLTEAMACGTAVVTTRGTAIWRQIEAAGGVIAEAAPDAVARAVTDLLDDPAGRAERGASGRRWAFDHLAVEPLSAAYAALYRGAADGFSASSPPVHSAL